MPRIARMVVGAADKRRVMINRPAFKAKYHIECVPGQGVFLLSENGSFVLEGVALQEVAPLIDGWRSAAEIAHLLRHKFPVREVYAALGLLEHEGHIQEADPTIPLML